MKGSVSTRSFRLHRNLASRLVEVEALCHELRALFTPEPLAASAFAVELLARETLNNAVLHGNAGDEGKRVVFELHCGRKWIRLSVSDQGPGFNWKNRPQALPSDIADGGRGLPILALYAERLQFNRAGNRVTLWLRRPPESANQRPQPGRKPAAAQPINQLESRIAS